jgi:transmembrane sensor
MPRPRKWRAVRIVAAISVAVAAIALTVSGTNSTKEYTTAIGEQRTAKLDDGSLVQLNTDTKISVTLSKSRRDIRLIRGEALFLVEHEPSRPFFVSAEKASVRVVGTSFNIRDRIDAVDVTVVEGAVQVTANEAIAENQHSTAAEVTRVSAGENARVASGKVVTSPVIDVAETLSWRERRLVFHEATLEDMAREFNRYNKAQIKIVGSAASRIPFKTATFSADRPQSLILYLSKDASVNIESANNTWVIRDR